VFDEVYTNNYQSKDHKLTVRTVDTSSEGYQCAVKYMIRVNEKDFSNPDHLQKLAATAKMSPEEFKKEFEYLVQ
jgi:AraC-like DNA-binding protein